MSWNIHRIYGCGCRNIMTGCPDEQGRWLSGYTNVTGAMWLDCGRNPAESLQRAFRINPQESLGARLGNARNRLVALNITILRAYEIFRVGGRDGLADDATLDALDAEEMGVGNDTGPHRQQLLDTETPNFESRLHDIIVVDGVSYSDKRRGTWCISKLRANSWTCSGS
ncbi:MAG: hypothetical protein M1832_001366 [Thelocarpon impressellum]|nr:MAG: hypothetical protein M1832_001366 [Thelocarpon impressellum]